MFLASTATSVHLPDLISDLGLILVTAAIAVLLFRVLKQPLVLGYLVAGFLAGNQFVVPVSALNTCSRLLACGCKETIFEVSGKGDSNNS